MYIVAHKAEIIAELHAIALRNPVLSDSQLQGHTKSIARRYKLPNMVLRQKEMFITPFTVRLSNLDLKSKYGSWSQIATMSVVLPFSGKVEYPTLEPYESWILTSPTPEGFVRGHTLVYSFDAYLEKCDQRIVGNCIEAWRDRIEEWTALLNKQIDAFNDALVQYASDTLQKQSYDISNARREMERLPYPIKTL